jgi:hypothetical protein
MKKIAKTTIVFLILNQLASNSVFAALLVNYTFDGPDESFVTSPAEVHPLLSLASDWETSGTLRNFEGLSGQAIAHNGNHTFSFSLEVEEGWSLDIESIGFWARRSASGSPDWHLLLNGTEILLDTAMSSDSGGVLYEPMAISAAESNSLSGLVLLELITANASSSQGTFRVDDFEIRGSFTAIPEPRAVGIVIGLVAVVTGARRAVAGATRPRESVCR